MSPVFDAYVMVDWSAASEPKQGADSVWIAVRERDDGEMASERLFNPPTRRAASALLADLFSDLIARDRVVLAGFDFAFGYPAGFARRLRPGASDWRAVWRELAGRISDADDNANNRFEVAAALNRQVAGGGFPFWGCPRGRPYDPDLAAKKPRLFGEDSLGEFRLAEQAAPGPKATPKSVWQLNGAGSVGGQTLIGVAHLERLRRHPWLAGSVRVWPFETGLATLARPGAGGWRVLFCEIYPSLLDARAAIGEPRDAAQVRLAAGRFAALDDAGELADVFAGPADLDAADRARVEREEGWILGVDRAQTLGAGAPRGPATVIRFDAARPERGSSPPSPAPAPPPAPAAAFAWLRDPEEIYRRSFATILAEAELSGVPASARAMAVRLIHACGDPSIGPDLRISGDPVAAAQAALAAGAPVLVDAQMVAAGIIRARLPAQTRVIVTLAAAGVAEAARAARTTRSAAAIDLSRDALAGAVVAIGNAPTALFRLLELLRDGAAPPAAIFAFPVGFVGAAESKEALLASPSAPPFATLRGRRGGSAMAAAAINALGAAEER